jgi:hypothetical protein
LEGATCLREIARKEKSENPIVLAQAQDLARRLASTGATTPYELVWEAFAETKSNPGPDQIGEFLKRFDIERPIETLAAAMKLSQNTLVLNLKSFMCVRHECAHTGSAQVMPTTSDLRSYCDLIELVANGIGQVFQDMLNGAPYAPAIGSAISTLAPPIPTAPTSPAVPATTSTIATLSTSATQGLVPGAVSGVVTPPLRNPLRWTYDRLRSIFRWFASL